MTNLVVSYHVHSFHRLRPGEFCQVRAEPFLHKLFELAIQVDRAAEPTAADRYFINSEKR